MAYIALDKLLMRLEKLYPKYIDLSLNRLNILLKKLDNPHLNLPPTIHIAGTNGKGSTLSFIKQILIEHHYKIHCYTSPHLKSITERFVITNKTISNKKLYETLRYIEIINNKDKLVKKNTVNEYYFVHSYFFDCGHKKNIIGRTKYGINFASFISKENIYGVQFHPEKSSKQGLELIKNFLKL